MTLRDQMAELLPGLRWTSVTEWMTDGMLGDRHVARAYQTLSHLIVVTILDKVWRGKCQSPAHAAKTILRKLREFRDICDKALGEKT